MAMRTSKIIGFKAFHDTDQDILNWWETLPERERSRALRELIRNGLSVVRKSKSPLDPETLRRLCDDTAWIRGALDEMPTYLERLVAQVQATQPVVQSVPQEGNQPNTPQLSQAATDQRRTKMRQATW